jgi:Spy/CpxP family protein refolding chaperone
MKPIARKLKKPELALGLVCLFSPLDQATGAEPPPDGGPIPERGNRAERGGRGGGTVLDDQQWRLFSEMLQKYRGDLDKIEGQLRAAVAELMKVTLADSYDEKGAREKAEAVGRLQVEIMLRRCQTLSAIAPTLRSDQRQELLAGRGGFMLLAGDFTGPGERGPGRLVFGEDRRQAPRRPTDPVAENLFPPELVKRFQGEIGLTDEQQQTMIAALQKAQPRFEQLRQQVETETAVLVALLRKERVDVDSALAQSDKLLDIEREMRRTHLALQIAIKNALTPDQQEKLQDLRRRNAPEDVLEPGPPRRIQEKMQRLDAGIQRRERASQDASNIGQLMGKLESLMREGRFKDAEEVLDHALQLLEEKRPR